MSSYRQLQSYPQQDQYYMPHQQQQQHMPHHHQQYQQQQHQYQQQQYQHQHHFPTSQPVNYPLQSQPSYHGPYYPQYLSQTGDNGNDPVPLASNHPVPLAPAVHPVLLAASLQPRQQLGSRHQAEAAASFFRTQAQPPPRLARLPSLGSETEEEPELATNFRWILSQ